LQERPLTSHVDFWVDEQAPSFQQQREERPMANDRYRYDSDRDEDGYIARRGFGNERAGYDRDRTRDEGSTRNRERDFGDSAGYGTGGSARDWRDVVSDSDYDRSVFDMDRSRDTGYGPDYSSSASYSHASNRDRHRHGSRHESDSFGRGSRDYQEDRGFFERAGDEVRSWFGDEDAERRRDRDMREAGYHRGRGPKGYQRSDARITEDVNDRLTDDPHLDASEIEVSVTGREVTLTGTVNSRFEKRHAEDLAESVSGVSHVQNNLRVQQYADAGMGGTMSSGAGAAGAGSMGSTGDMTGSSQANRGPRTRSTS
jgi:osmotically-inducible protein OsmY